MALTDDRLAALASYCRVDEDDVLLAPLYDAAVGYLDTAGVRVPEDGTPRAAQYDMCINYLVLDMYDRRDATLDGAANDNPAVRRLISQLKLSEPVPESGTGSEGE